MSTFRGFDKYMMDRVAKAGGHYFDVASLRYFNAYGGTYLQATPDDIVMVESVKSPHGNREYRVINVKFSHQPDNNGTDREHVYVSSCTDMHSTAARAIAEFRAGSPMVSS